MSIDEKDQALNLGGKYNLDLERNSEESWEPDV